jgi:nitroreductase
MNKSLDMPRIEIIMDKQSVLLALEQRTSTNYFDGSKSISDEEIKQLVYYASQAPSSSNLQHWRFLALTDAKQKNLLRSHAFNQKKISDASVAFLVLADLRAIEEHPRLTDENVRMGVFDEGMRETWIQLAEGYRDKPQINRDEAFRSGALASMNLITAAQASGYASCAMAGFDEAAIRQSFEIPERYLITLILVVGYPAPGNWIKKFRKPVGEILCFNRSNLPA